MQTKLIASLALCPLLFSQTAEKPPALPENITKIIRVHSDPRMLVELVRPVSAARIQGDNTLRVIVAMGTPADVAGVEQLIRDLDTVGDNDPRAKNIELVIYVLNGTIDAAADGRSEPDLAALAPVYKQLRAVFPFKSYELLSTMLMRSSQNTPTTQDGMMKSLQNNPDFSDPGTYRIQYDGAAVSGDVSPIIHLTKFQFSAHIPVVAGTLKNKEGAVTTTQWTTRTLGIETNLDLREGQKVVVGTSNVEPAGTTIFVVVTAKLL